MIQNHWYTIQNLWHTIQNHWHTIQNLNTIEGIIFSRLQIRLSCILVLPFSSKMHSFSLGKLIFLSGILLQTNAKTSVQIFCGTIFLMLSSCLLFRGLVFKFGRTEDLWQWWTPVCLYVHCLYTLLSILCDTICFSGYSLCISTFLAFQLTYLIYIMCCIMAKS